MMSLWSRGACPEVETNGLAVSTFGGRFGIALGEASLPKVPRGSSFGIDDAPEWSLSASDLVALACVTAAAICVYVPAPFPDGAPLIEPYPGGTYVQTKVAMDASESFVSWVPGVQDLTSASQLFSDIDAAIVEGNRPKALDAIYDTVEDLLLSARFGAAQCILDAATYRALTECTLPQSAFLSLLTVTRPWKDHLRRSREELARAVSMRFRDDSSAAPSEVVLGLL